MLEAYSLIKRGGNDERIKKYTNKESNSNIQQGNKDVLNLLPHSQAGKND